MLFEQIGRQYVMIETVNINDQSYTGKWIVRQTNSINQWVTEWVPIDKKCNFMLPAQRLFQTVDDAVQTAADATRLGVVLHHGKWHPDRMVGPVQPQSYEMFHQPTSDINWA